MLLSESSLTRKLATMLFESVSCVLGSYEPDKLNSFQDNTDGSADFLSSSNASQLEQNEEWANIRGVKRNKVARSPVSMTLCGVAEIHK